MAIFFRKTTINQSVLRLLDQVPGPVSETALRQQLGAAGVMAHKTTLYRQLEKLVEAGKVEQSRFADGVTRYERKKAHHHHIICRSCQRIEDIEVGAHLQTEERRIARRAGFHSVSHALEFYGICPNCTSPLSA
ncbi:MAG: transcriptional repressor [Patescibacteria group bacterium]